MPEKFEEISQQQQEQKPESAELHQSLRYLAWIAALIYISIVSFLPFILLGETALTPLLFGASFFITTLLFLAAWVGWLIIHQRRNLPLSLRHGLPLLAVPTAIGLFYLLAVVG